MEHEFIVDREMSSFFKVHQKWKEAIVYSERAKNFVPTKAKILGLDTGPMDPILKYNFVNIYRNICDHESALRLLEEYKDDIFDNKQKIIMEKNMIDYELNRFEIAKINFKMAADTFGSTTQMDFFSLEMATTQHIVDCLGDSMDAFIIKYKDIFKVIHAEKMKALMVDERPLWQIKKDWGECDILSIPEKEEPNESPCLERVRYNKYVQFYQTYMRSAWHDVLWQKALQENKDFNIPIFIESHAKLHEIVKDFKQIIKITRMLHAREPLYCHAFRRFKDFSQMKRLKEANLNRKQYQTRRKVMQIIRTAKELRAKKELKKLGLYVRESMAQIVFCQPLRLLPWKLEAVHEVYNILGLAYLDNLLSQISKPVHEKGFDQLLELLQLPNHQVIVKKPKLNFLDRSTFVTEKSEKEAAIIAKEAFLPPILAHISHSNHAIERCALYHEIAVYFLSNNRPIETIAFGKKALKELKSTKNHLWFFLCCMIILKAYASNRKIELAWKMLEGAQKMSSYLKDANVAAFVTLCQEIVKHELMVNELKKRERNIFLKTRRSGRSEDSSMISRSGMSMGSSFLTTAS